jgi:hypothetical protein
MAQYDHEGRIKRLEKTVNQLTSIVKAAGLFDDFVPLSQAAKLLSCQTWVIRQRIKTDASVKLDIHYRLNGNRYLINVTEWQNLIHADVKAKRQ